MAEASKGTVLFVGTEFQNLAFGCSGLAECRLDSNRSKLQAYPKVRSSRMTSAAHHMHCSSSLHIVLVDNQSTHRQSKGGMKNGDWIDGNLLRSHGGWVFPLILMLV